MIALTPVARRVTYVIFFELFAILLSTLLLSTLSSDGAPGSLPVAVGSSLAAVCWNFIFNTIFESWERRNNIESRQLSHRIAHAAGFEAGLVIILIPLFMWWYQVGLLDALRMELALLVFFFVFTFLFTWLFDRMVPVSKVEVR